MQTRLALADIVRDAAIQVRDRIDPATVEQYADDWPLLPPIAVYRLPDGRLVLVDGWHRYAAAELLRLVEVEATVYDGDYTAAQDHAARANMSGARALKKEERHRAIAETYARHKPIDQRALATLLGISLGTVSKVLRLEDVKADVSGALFINEQAALPAGRGRRKRAVKDDHLVELAAAPKEERVPLVEATASRGWSPRETRAAVAEINDPTTPPERKEALRSGAADPLVHSASGQPEALPETFARAMAEPTPYDAYAVYVTAAEHLAKLALLEPDDVVRSRGASDLRDLAYDDLRIPRYIGVLEAIREAARRALRPGAQEIEA